MYKINFIYLFIQLFIIYKDKPKLNMNNKKNKLGNELLHRGAGLCSGVFFVVTDYHKV